MIEDRENRRELTILRAQERQDRCNFNNYFPAENTRGVDGVTGAPCVYYARRHYKKQMGFFAAGRKYHQRLFMAANRVGKTETGAFELTCHATGIYPDWWLGKRFDTPGEWWACGTNSETTRDIVQTKLLGPANTDGTILPGGMIPPHLVLHTQRRAGSLPGALEQIWVRHKSGGHTTIAFKTYEQGRKSFEGTSKQGIWCDEEPPEDIWTEMLLRLVTTKGIAIVTFTPLQGMSAVVKGFVQPDNPLALEFKFTVQAGWADVPHLDPETQRIYMATVPKYQLDARTKGIPMLGAGAIYAFPEDGITVAPFEIPKHWRRCFGMDAGGGVKATAVAYGAIDPVAQVLYIHDAYKRESPEVAIHIEAMKARGKWVPGVGDAAALVMTAHDATQLIAIYQGAGIDLELPDKAVETGIQEVWELMSAGRFKVFANLEPWWGEWRMYHRDEKGRIVKKDDHLMDATRYLVRSGRARAISQNEYDARNRTADTASGGARADWMS